MHAEEHKPSFKVAEFPSLLTVFSSSSQTSLSSAAEAIFNTFYLSGKAQQANQLMKKITGSKGNIYGPIIWLIFWSANAWRTFVIYLTLITHLTALQETFLQNNFLCNAACNNFLLFSKHNKTIIYLQLLLQLRSAITTRTTHSAPHDC